MRIMNRSKVGAIALGLACCAWAHDGNIGKGGVYSHLENGKFESGVVGSTPGTTVGGVASGGAPWVVATGEASAAGNGQLHVKVSGLLIDDGAGVPATLVGTVGPVTMVAASLVCGGSGGAVVASSDGVPLSAAGNAEINATVALPATCSAPVVLVRIFTPSAPVGSQLGKFIALSGFNAGADAKNNNDDERDGHND